MASPHFLEAFSPQQREVVQAGEGPLSILAGPGSGKTTSLTGRIAYLVEERGVSPSSILAITFTTAAAATVRQRLAGVLGGRSRQFDVATFHALGLRIVRQWSAELGFGRYPPAVYGRDDARTLLREVATEIGLDLAPDRGAPDIDPWSLSAAKLASAVERFRLRTVEAALPWEDEEGLEEELVRQVAEAYEARLHERGAIDYAGMLVLPVRLLRVEPRALRILQDTYRFVMLDEAQDSCHIQNSLLQLIVERHRNLMVMGDPHQCLPPGTLVGTPAGEVPIESIRPGDAVVAGVGRGQVLAARVSEAISRQFEGNLVRVTLKSGRAIRMTPAHMCFARQGCSRSSYYVYLMYRLEFGYRVGIASGAIYDSHLGGHVNGLQFRTRQERADKAWILRVCRTREEAAFHEVLFSLQYGIPTTIFNADWRRGDSQQMIDRLFATIDTRAAAARLLADQGLHFEYPHHRPQAYAANERARRLEVHLTAFGASQISDRTPWHFHRVWLNSSDRLTKEQVQRSSLVARRARGVTWRVQREARDLNVAESLAARLAAIGNTEVARWAKLSSGPKFAFQPASQLRPTMIVPVLEKGEVVEDEIVAIDSEPYAGPVYDLNVENLHNYAADGLVVHNCIFSWRGADPMILLDFPRTYPGARVIVLNENHRSTGVIVAMANAVAAPLQYRPDSWTQNPAGPRARVYTAADESDEARFVAAEISQLLRTGELAHPGQAAVLFRTNAQARALALALRAEGIPFRVRGDADLFSRPEVRDLVAYLRLAHNPTDQHAVARIINTPPRRLRLIEQALRRRPVGVADLPLWAQKRGGPPGRRAVEALLALLQQLHQDARGCQPVQVLELILDRTGYAVWLAAQQDGPARLSRIQELHAVVEGSPAPDLATWLADWHLGDADGPVDTHAEVVALTTIHGAKGAEWPVVFVVGLEEGLLPRGRGVRGSQAAAEDDEERRLTYVAFSRPQVLLYLTYCRTRRLVFDAREGPPEPRHPSRFLRPLPAELIESVG